MEKGAGVCSLGLQYSPKAFSALFIYFFDKTSFMKRKYGFLKLMIILLLGMFIGYLASFDFQTEEESAVADSQRVINLAAVDSQGNGVTIPLVVEIKPGNGKILTDIDKLLFWVDTQQSIQVARSVAENVTGISTKNIDLIYTIRYENLSLVGGPSAGAAMTIATIALLQNRSLRDDVVITGTINEDGTIGKVGGIEEKASAAKEAGAKIFLVPEGLGTETKVKPIESCKKIGRLEYCETTYQKITINISEKVGIAVVEVSNVEEASKYFLI